MSYEWIFSVSRTFCLPLSALAIITRSACIAAGIIISFSPSPGLLVPKVSLSFFSRRTIERADISF